jgi:hypothetical protein
MRATTRIINPMTRHHLILQPFPEILKPVLHRMTLKLINILDRNALIRSHFNFQAWNTIKYSFTILNFVAI